jgi:hypothetical protein
VAKIGHFGAIMSGGSQKASQNWPKVQLKLAKSTVETGQKYSQNWP